jgi:DNA repair exonuclease SbcCD ATPase subunit
MIKSLALENFMSHLATRIDLAPGVTVITGPNNVGKSAVVEAVRSLVQNPSQKHSIRHGARQAVVRLVLDSGEIIEWVRTDRTAYYRLFRPEDGGREEAGEPAEYRKIGLTVPEDIRSRLRLGLVETDSGDIDIHIGNQREPIFLLNSPGSQAAGFFAASSEAEYLLGMRQALKRREDYAKTTRKVLASDCQTQEKALLRYEPLDSLESELEQAEKTYELICHHQQSLPALSGCIGRLADQERTLSQQQQGAALLSGLEHPPELAEIAHLEAWLQRWRQIAGKAEVAAAGLEVLAPLSPHPPLMAAAPLAHLAGRLAATELLLQQRRQEKASLADLSEPPVSRDVLPLEDLINDLHSRENLKNRARRRQETLAGLAGPAAPAEVGDLLRLIAQLARLHTRQRYLEGMSGTLAALVSLPEMAPVPDLEKLIAQTAGLIQEISRQEQERDSLEVALQQKRTEVAALIRATGLCPLCGSPMDVAHFLEAGHG